MMKKNVLLVMIVLLGMGQSAFAYDFSAVAPSGQTLYYNIVNGAAQVTYQNSSSPRYTNLTGILTIPSSVTYNGTTYSVTSIGDDAFSNCSGLTSVTILNSVTSIGQETFRSCSGLTSVTIPNSVASIGDFAFYGCSSLTSITIPFGVTLIGTSTFSYCSSLTSVSIPASVTNIGNNAFYDCSSLASVTIPAIVTSIGSNAFYNCSGLISVNIPNSVITIGSGAFKNCSSLISVTIPNSVTSIGNNAFYDCSSLTSVTIPNSVTSIGNNAFYRVRHIEYYGNASGAPWGAYSMNGVIDGDFVYSDSTKHKLTAYLGNGGPITILPTVDTIGDMTFYNCSSLTSVTIPNSVTLIGSFAFYNCSGLTSVFIPNGVISIGGSAFKDCSGLTSVNIPNSVTSIGGNAFNGCSGLTSVNIPNSVTSIGGGAFAGCSGLISIYISNSVTSISATTFSGCSGLTSVNIPNCVTSIGGNAFNGCSSLTSVTIPDSVTSIGNFAFYGCINLTVMWMKPATPPILGNAASISDSIIDLVVPHNSYTAYNSASENYTRHRIHRDSIFVVANVNDTSFGYMAEFNSVYVYPSIYDTLTLTAIPNPHYHFMRWNDGNTDNPRQYIITGDTTITAFFAIDTHTVNVQSNDFMRGMAEASNEQVEYGKPCTVTATAYTGYTFASWSNGVTANPYTFAVISDVELTALFVEEGEEVYTVTVESADPTMGTVSGGGQALSGGTVTITAIPNEGYRFLTWNDGNTENPRTVTVTGNITYTAYFENTQGIEEVGGQRSEGRVYAAEGKIVVDGAEGETVRVYDVTGRMVQTFTHSSHQALPAGVYMVKVGQHPARKVVVLR